MILWSVYRLDYDECLNRLDKGLVAAERIGNDF